MLKQRIIATLVIKNNIVVQSIDFEKYLPVGNINIAVEALNDWGVDEITILDIDATKEKRTIDSNLIKELSKFALVPISVGGGIQNNAQIKELLSSGADKVCINQSFLHNKNLIQEASHTFGVQCIIVSLDIKKVKDKYFIYDYLTKKASIEMTEAIQTAQRLGAGEVLINSVDNDGKQCGYDLEMIKVACDISTVPIIAQGGAKNPLDIEEAIKIKELSAISAANMFHFTEHSVTVTKSFLKRDIQYPVRLESHTNYKEFNFDEDGRLLKKNEIELASQVFETHEKEVI